MLQSEHLSPRIARFLPEDRISEIDASIGELLGLHPSIWQLIQRANELTRQLARSGQVILVGRGANFATQGITGGLHLRLVAPADTRAHRRAAELGTTPEVAATENMKTDAARRNYVRSVFESDISRASAYDLVLNVGSMPLELATDLVARVLHNRVSAPAAS